VNKARGAKIHWGLLLKRVNTKEQPDLPEAATQSPIQTPPVPRDEDEQYVAESDPEEEPKENEDDETEDGPVDYPMDGGDDGDDDNGELSGDDADDEDEDEEDEEEEDDIPEIEMPPRKRLCLSTLGSRYEIREGFTARLTEGQGIDYGFVSTLDAKARRRGIREVRVTELHDTQDLYALLEDAQDSKTRISQRVAMDSQRVDLLMEDMIAYQVTILIVEEEAYVAREAWAHSIGLSQAVHFELQTHWEQVRQAQMVETLRVMGDMRQEMGDMQAELLALREQPRRAR
nr:hypothetical protein [Tanacetum cinerariifolium]